MIHVINRQQNLAVDLKTAWSFFSDPYNLPIITPADMDFKITSSLVPRSIYPGLIITYHVRPLFGFLVSWVSEITHVREPFYFVDEQRAGPYRLWHHEHFFREINGGTEVRDIIHYTVPFGPIGRLADSLLIRKRLESIFDYRKLKLIELFGSMDASNYS